MWLLSGACSCQELMVKQVQWVMLRAPYVPCTSREGVEVEGGRVA